MKNGGGDWRLENTTQGTILIYSIDSPFTEGLFCTEHLIRLDCGQWMSHALFWVKKSLNRTHFDSPVYFNFPIVLGFVVCTWCRSMCVVTKLDNIMWLVCKIMPNFCMLYRNDYTVEQLKFWNTIVLTCKQAIYQVWSWYGVGNWFCIS